MINAILWIIANIGTVIKLVSWLIDLFGGDKKAAQSCVGDACKAFTSNDKEAISSFLETLLEKIK